LGFFTVSCALSVQEEESIGFLFRVKILVQVDATAMGRYKQTALHSAKRKRQPLLKNSR
jgi:hypothetical protein